MTIGAQYGSDPPRGSKRWAQLFGSSTPMTWRPSDAGRCSNAAQEGVLDDRQRTHERVEDGRGAERRREARLQSRSGAAGLIDPPTGASRSQSRACEVHGGNDLTRNRIRTV